MIEVESQTSRPRRPTRSAVGLLLCFLAASCSSGGEDGQVEATASQEVPGTINLAVGPEVRSFGLREADCERVESGDEPFLHVVAHANRRHKLEDGRLARPNLLTARLPVDLGDEEVRFGPGDDAYGATASVIGPQYAGEEYAMLQVLAKPAEGIEREYACRASRDGRKLQVVCNKATVFPWTAPGPVPVGSFKASLVCK